MAEHDVNDNPHAHSKQSKNHVVALVCVAVFMTMVGAAYAAVPLYQIFCQVTGYGGTTQRAEATSGVVLKRQMKVQFDANIANGLAWQFKPVQLEAEGPIGAQQLIFYKAHNNSDKAITGTASFNVSPAKAGIYFNKIECFCFTEQRLEAGQSVDMPVVFFIDPEIDKDPDLKQLKTITLSYTFYPVDEPQETTQTSSALSGKEKTIN